MIVCRMIVACPRPQGFDSGLASARGYVPAVWAGRSGSGCRRGSSGESGPAAADHDHRGGGLGDDRQVHCGPVER